MNEVVIKMRRKNLSVYNMKPCLSQYIKKTYLWSGLDKKIGPKYKGDQDPLTIFNNNSYFVILISLALPQK